MSDEEATDVERIARWARPGETPTLTHTMREYLARHVGVAEPDAPVDARAWTPAPSRLSADVVERLVAAVGVDNVGRDDRSRLRACGGASYLDYARRRRGLVDDAPDAVVAPATHDEVVAVLGICSDAGVAVVPHGGGTSVVGGLREQRPHIAVALRRMDRLVGIDEESAIATVEPGMIGPRLEPILAARGFTLGHLPQSWERATIGGYAATRSAGQASTGYGRSDDMVVGLRLAIPPDAVPGSGGEWRAGHPPASAAGPDLLGLALGSEGALGIITEASLRVRRLPGEQRYEAVALPGFEAGLEAFRAMAQSGACADVMRLSDSTETRTTLLASGPHGVQARALRGYLSLRGIDESAGMCLAVLGWEGATRGEIAARRSASAPILRRAGAVGLGRGAGAAWRRSRFAGPRLRDALLDAGYVVETVETATRWSALRGLRERIHDAAALSLGPGPGPLVMTHVSHVYETGASLYTTIVAAVGSRDRIEAWQEAKARITAAIVDGGGTLTHHHAVGRDHAPWLLREIGPAGLAILAAVKARLDPAGVLNPGVLALP